MGLVMEGPWKIQSGGRFLISIYNKINILYGRGPNNKKPGMRSCRVFFVARGLGLRRAGAALPP
jgi:hypothetical protein